MKKKNMWPIWSILIAMSASFVNESSAQTQQSTFFQFSKARQGRLGRNVGPIEVIPSLLDSPNNIVTYGGEKEGSSWRIMKAVGPTGIQFKRFIDSLSINNQKILLSHFLSKWSSGAYRVQSDIVDHEGTNKNISYDFIGQMRRENYSNMELVRLKQIFEKWLEQTSDRPFSYISPATRMKFFNAALPGINSAEGAQKVRSVLVDGYYDWIPHFGLAQKYLEEKRTVHTTGVETGDRPPGWEINFRPQKTPMDLEDMQRWLQTALGINGNPFQRMGHVWMVMPELDLTQSENIQYVKHLAELYRMIQLRIVLRGLRGNTGIETSNFKSVHNGSTLESLETYRGVIRLEEDRFAPKTRACEFRAGTKDEYVQNFHQELLTAYASTNDFGRLAQIDDYQLLPEFLTSLAAFNWKTCYPNAKKELRAMTAKVGIEPEVMKKFIKVIGKAKRSYAGGDRNIDPSYLVPLWNWTHAPFTANKIKILNSATADFVEEVAKIRDANPLGKIKLAIKEWITYTNLLQDLDAYLFPTRDHNEIDRKFKVMGREGRSVDGRAKIDVNKVHMGIEFTARFSTKDINAYTGPIWGDGKIVHLDKTYGLEMDERKHRILNVCRSISNNLGLPENNPIVWALSGNTHGHGLGIVFTFNDQLGRPWRCEWDGIGRTYDMNQQVIPKSLRGGHIEIVTPKGVLSDNELFAIFEGFRQNNSVPEPTVGGGHINVDLKDFMDRPKAFARFLTAFHQYRGTIALMFQRPSRVPGAMPVEVDRSFSNDLLNFSGTTAQLQKLLYEKKYFNYMVGRKTRYLQLDIAAYFQNVIPEKFIGEEPDIGNPFLNWHPAFKVDPMIRKMEFRLFNAPRTEHEFIMMRKVVRALLHKALNNASDLIGRVQPVRHQWYVDVKDEGLRKIRIEKAFTELNEMLEDLELTEYKNDYEFYLADGLSTSQEYFKSFNHARKMERDELELVTPVGGWERAVYPPRGMNEGPSYIGRQVGLTPAVMKRKINRFKRARVQRAAEGKRKRSLYDHGHKVEENERILSKRRKVMRPKLTYYYPEEAEDLMEVDLGEDSESDS